MIISTGQCSIVLYLCTYTHGTGHLAGVVNHSWFRFILQSRKCGMTATAITNLLLTQSVLHMLKVSSTTKKEKIDIMNHENDDIFTTSISNHVLLCGLVHVLDAIAKIQLTCIAHIERKTKAIRSTLFHYLNMSPNSASSTHTRCW